MSAQNSVPDSSEPKITLDDLKHRTEAITDMAVSDAKEAVAAVARTDAAKKVMIAVGVVLAVASVAYFMGSRAVRGRIEDAY